MEYHFLRVKNHIYASIFVQDIIEILLIVKAL